LRGYEIDDEEQSCESLVGERPPGPIPQKEDGRIFQEEQAYEDREADQCLILEA